jgi:hypothetical protein
MQDVKTMEGYEEMMKKPTSSLTPEQRLTGLAHEPRLAGLAHEQVRCGPRCL